MTQRNAINVEGNWQWAYAAITLVGTATETSLSIGSFPGGTLPK
jgi:transposase-like protein